MKITDYIAHFLYKQGVEHVFELSGGMITHILDSLFELKKIKIITMHHEQAAAFAADAYGRIKKVPGVALATSGPGATNLLTGIGSCYFDSSPAVFITGQVNTHEQKGNKNIRQLGFQETDIVSMAKPITKKVFKIEKAVDVPKIFQEAFELSISGRPGPVLIDIPMNIQREDISVKEENIKKVEKAYSLNQPIKAETLEKLATDVLSSKRPLILAGRGVSAMQASDYFLKFAEQINVPVVTSLLGLDSIPYNHSLRVGFIGSYGNRWANLAIGESDLIIVLGSRLDIRQTGADVKSFKGSKKIYHVDCEIAEINNRVENCIPIVADVAQFLEQAIKFFSSKPNFTVKADWMNEIAQLKNKWKDTDEIKDITGINPNAFVHALSQRSAETKSFIADVGSHQMWTAQSLELGKGQAYITSGGMGAMGFALPASIGAAIATNKSATVISGDGGMQLNIQELQTIVRNKLPIKIIVLNNKSLGMIRQFQDSYFDSKHQSTVWGYSAPDFESIAKAYGIDALTISQEKEIPNAMDVMWKDSKSPFLLQVMIDPKANAYPKIAFGKPITEMEPLSIPLDMEGT